MELSNVSDEVKALNPDMFPPVEKKPSKYRNVPVKLDGMSFDSGKEAVDAGKFALGVRAGEWIAYLHHVRVKLPGNILMELDHVLINKQFEVEVYETKAFDKKTGKPIMTQDWKLKAKLFEATYEKKIQII